VDRKISHHHQWGMVCPAFMLGTKQKDQSMKCAFKLRLIK
jgi:hypothetical protein